ncbi:recombinase RecT [Lewinella sp. W8]|uniref:recombinase RecT n=1 Tax=Lewinella sp. W8 TaxID=2528208 RepID=UPI0010673646|nr:recombinase RecT [Lewinella sp. W8]MTB53068.1 hypothetical protein [Lewinella sp. W8]
MSNQNNSLRVVDPVKGRIKVMGLNLKDVEKEANFALRLIQENPKIGQATRESIGNAVLDVVSLGLTLNPAHQYAYLEARWFKGSGTTKAVLQVTSRGLNFLAIKEGAITSSNSQVVYAADVFHADLGNPKKPITHEVKGFSRGKVVGVYSIGHLPDGNCIAELITKEESDRILASSTSPAAKIYPDEFRRKTAFKRMIKRTSWGANDSLLARAISFDNKFHDQNKDMELAAQATEAPPEPSKIIQGSEEWNKCVRGIAAGHTWDRVKEFFDVTKEQMKLIDKEAVEYNLRKDLEQTAQPETAE